MKTRLSLALVVVSLTAGLLPGPAAALGACTDTKAAVVSVAAPPTNPVGNYPSCVPDMSCPNVGGCWVKMRGSVTGAGVVSLEMLAEGLTEPVACGPALRGCGVDSERFFVPFGTVRALCQTKIAVAVNVTVTCGPVFA